MVPGGLELFTGGQKMAESRTFRFQIISDFHILTLFCVSNYFRFEVLEWLQVKLFQIFKKNLDDIVL